MAKKKQGNLPAEVETSITELSPGEVREAKCVELFETAVDGERTGSLRLSLTEHTAKAAVRRSC